MAHLSLYLLKNEHWKEHCPVKVCLTNRNTSQSLYIEIIKEGYEHKHSHKWCEMNVDQPIFKAIGIFTYKEWNVCAAFLWLTKETGR